MIIALQISSSTPPIPSTNLQANQPPTPNVPQNRGISVSIYTVVLSCIFYDDGVHMNKILNIVVYKNFLIATRFSVT